MAHFGEAGSSRSQKYGSIKGRLSHSASPHANRPARFQSEPVGRHDLSRLLLHAVVFLHHTVIFLHAVLGHGVFLHAVVLLHGVLRHGVFLHAVILLHVVGGEGGRERQAERDGGSRDSKRDTGANGHRSFILFESGSDSDTCRWWYGRARIWVCYRQNRKKLPYDGHLAIGMGPDR